MKILNFTANPDIVTKSPFVSSEIQIKKLVQHQKAFLNDLSELNIASIHLKANNFPCLNYNYYKNPLLHRIKAVIEPESKLFMPDSNNCSIKTIFFHNEESASKHRQSIEQEVNLKLMAFVNKGQINGKISRMIKIDSDYRRSYEKVAESYKRIGFLAKKPLFPQGSQAPGVNGIESCRSRNKPSRFSQNFSEDSLEASTSRSSSANHRRLGFLFSFV